MAIRALARLALRVSDAGCSEAERIRKIHERLLPAARVDAQEAAEAESEKEYKDRQSEHRAIKPFKRGFLAIDDKCGQRLFFAWEKSRKARRLCGGIISASSSFGVINTLIRVLES